MGAQDAVLLFEFPVWILGVGMTAFFFYMILSSLFAPQHVKRNYEKAFLPRYSAYTFFFIIYITTSLIISCPLAMVFYFTGMPLQYSILILIIVTIGCWIYAVNEVWDQYRLYYKKNDTANDHR